MFGILGLGFLLGMQHALEADHIAAVSTHRRAPQRCRRYRQAWPDLGARPHPDAVRLCRRGDPARARHPRTSGAADRDRRRHHAGRPRRACAVAAVARPRAFSPPRPWRRHRPYPRRTAMPAKRVAACPRAHAHAHGFRWRTLLVGLMHGMAGSAALLVLTVRRPPVPRSGWPMSRCSGSAR